MAAAAPQQPLDARARRWTLLAASACLLPLLLQLPGTLGVAIGGVAAVVIALGWQRLVLPGWLRLLLAVSLVGGVLFASRFQFGRDTGCALLAAMLAIKPVELSSVRDARSLLGFGLFAPFATFLLDQGPLPLLLGLAGAMLALAALLLLADLEAGERVHPSKPWPVLAAVGRLVAVGLPLALATFWLFPRLATPLWGVPERAIARPGLSDTMAPGGWLDFMNDDTPALRVQFVGATPPSSEMYWRGPVLGEFDGRTWTRARWSRSLPPATVLPSSRRYEYTLEMEPTDRRQLVALELVSAAPEGLNLSQDHGLYAPRPLSATTRWHMRSAAPRAFEPDLKVMLRQAALRLPEGYNPRTLALARQWRREAGSDDAAIVERGLRWIRAEFAYTLETPLPGRHAVDEFLFEQKAGFCEHYASAFVVLLRAAGIPARVVTGYVGGYRNPLGDYWLVRNSDAHAWAEAWLPGRGWVRVDPTAAVAPERIYDTLDDRAPGAFGAFDALTPMFNAGDWLRRGWNDLVLGFDADRQQRILSSVGVDELDGQELAVMFLGVAGLALGWMLWLTARGERERDPLLRAWHRIDARYSRLGLGRMDHEPALAWSARVAAQRPATDLPALSGRFAAARYAPRRPGSTAPGGDRDLLRDLRRHRP